MRCSLASYLGTVTPIIQATRRLPAVVEAALTRHFDARLNREDRALTREDLRQAFRDCDGVLCTVTDRIDAELLEIAPRRVRILANFGVGYNNIDVDTARRHHVVVSNTPGVLTETTADLAVGLMLAVARRMGEGERALRAGHWKGWAPTHMMGSDLHGHTLGIIGLGRIGRAVARRAHHGFGMPVLAYTRRPVTPAEVDAMGVRQVGTLEELLEASDFVSLHCPATPETHHLLDATRLRRMKRSAYLINTARGSLVDEAALVEALVQGTIAGAGLDVYQHEPQVHPGLVGRENVVLLPHLGSATEATRAAMGMRAVENLRSFFAGGKPTDEVT